VQKKIALIFVTLMIVLSVVLTGCSTGSGITQAQLDAINAQLTDAQSQIATAQAALTQAVTEKTGVQAELQKAQASVTGLQNQDAVLQKQIDALKAQYQFTGLTTAQLVEKVTQNYHATHVYSKTDMFICGDMSAEVWNELKALNVPAVIVIGKIDASITDILQSDHAWVLADVGNGQKLALETTGGFVVPIAQNSLYYHGWTFSSPTDIKNNNNWINEYNTRAILLQYLDHERSVVNQEYQAAATQGNQILADQKEAIFNKLTEIIQAQDSVNKDLLVKIRGLATRF
jgi:hypothetical protein